MKDELRAGQLEFGDTIIHDDKVFIVSYAKYSRESKQCTIHLVESGTAEVLDINVPLDKVFKLA